MLNIKRYAAVMVVVAILMLPLTTYAGTDDAFYEVKASDTLGNIAEEYNTTVESITNQNSITNLDYIEAGQKIKIPDQTLGLEKTQYTVKQGDSLYIISKKYGMAWEEIMRLNNLNGSLIYPGQVLTITPGSGDLWIDVTLDKQVATAYYKGIAVKRMQVSSGAPGYDTPTGTFEIQNRGEWFYSWKYEEGAKYWVSFLYWGKYLFHTVPMDINRNIIEEEAAKIGQKASHGCLRLSVEDAKWIYENIPTRAKVVIR